MKYTEKLNKFYQIFYRHYASRVNNIIEKNIKHCLKHKIPDTYLSFDVNYYCDEEVNIKSINVLHGILLNFCNNENISKLKVTEYPQIHKVYIKFQKN